MYIYIFLFFIKDKKIKILKHKGIKVLKIIENIHEFMKIQSDIVKYLLP